MCIIGLIQRYIDVSGQLNGMMNKDTWMVRMKYITVSFVMHSVPPPT